MLFKKGNGETGDRETGRQEAGDRRREAGDRETGGRRQETGGRRQETGDADIVKHSWPYPSVSVPPGSGIRFLRKRHLANETVLLFRGIKGQVHTTLRLREDGRREVLHGLKSFILFRVLSG